MEQLDGVRALITGSTSGLGLGMARASRMRPPGS